MLTGLLFNPARAAESANPSKSVLVLYLFEKNTPGTTIFDQNLRAEFQSRLTDRITFYTEYLGLAEVANEASRQELLRLSRLKYAGRKLDLIIVVGVGKAQDLINAAAGVSPDTPIIFVQVGQSSLEIQSLRPGVTGVVVKLEYQKTLDIALRLQPDTRQVAVIAGTSQDDQHLLAQAREEFRLYEGKVEFTYLTNLTLAGYRQAVSQLPAHTVILYLAISHDATGEILYSPDALFMLAQAANVPIYGISETYLGRGIVGGRLPSYSAQGARAAEMGARILGGENLSNLPITTGPTLDMFDWRQLQRWGISADKLPPGSIVRYQKISFWQNYKRYIIGAIALIAVQALLIAFLLLEWAKRRRATQELQKSEWSFRQVFEHSQDPILIAHQDGDHLQVNQAACDLLGHTHEQLLRMKVSDLIPTGSPGTGERRQDDTREGSEEGEFSFARPDGVRRTFHYNTSRIAPGQTLSILRDITEHQHDQVLLAESERSLREAQTIAHLGHFRWDLITGAITWSDELYRIYGLQPGAPLTYETYIEHIHPEHREQVRQAVEQALSHQQPFKHEYLIVRAGEERWVFALGEPVVEADGKMIALQGVCQDITERKLAERANRESQARFAGIVDIADDAIISVDADQRITLFNKGAEKIFGYAAREIIGQPLDVLLPARFSERHRQYLTEFAGSAGVSRRMGERREIFGRRKNGHEFPAEASISKLSLAGEQIYTVMLRDITERKRAEAELRNSNEALQAINVQLQVATEELTCRKEELECRRDQLQALNNKLQVVNRQLETNLTELGRANSDLENLMTSADIGTIFLDRELRIKRFTPQSRRLFNIIPSDINRSIQHLTANFDDADLQADARRVLDESTIVEREIRSAEGDWYIMRLLPYRTQEGEVDGVVVTFVEITERKQAEMALSKSEERFRRYFELGLIGMAISSPTKGMLEMNDYICQILGYERSELLRITWAELTHPDDLEANVVQFNRVLAGEIDGYVMDKRCIRKDGEVIDVTISVKALRRADGSIDYLIALLEDITERKRFEAALNTSLETIRLLSEQLQAENIYLKEEIRLEHNFDEIIGNSNTLKYVLFRIEQVAPTDTTVLLLGETGTGKELAARAIHNLSPRKGRPFIKVNCAALPATLIESELFGYEKGAFTGAQARKAGRFEVADGGTIFLDEIGELPLELQSRLLRVLQEGEFERLGGSQTIRSNARIIAATNRNLKTEVEKGLFREDLWYRLNVFPITLPPLRQRTEDIPLLVRFFTEKFSLKLGKHIQSVSPATIRAMQGYSWPGNVRELANVIERAVISTQGPVLVLADKLESDREPAPSSRDTMSLEQIEREFILKRLEKTGWKIEGPHGAAQSLGLNPSTLRHRMNKLGISKTRVYDRSVRRDMI